MATEQSAILAWIIASLAGSIAIAIEAEPKLKQLELVLG